MKLIGSLSEIIDERGVFFVREYDDRKLINEGFEGHFTPDDNRTENILFRSIHNSFDSKNPRKGIIQCIERKIFEIEKLSKSFDFSKMGPKFDDEALFINYPLSLRNLSDYSAMNMEQRDVDLINALRSHLVRLLNWPVFILRAKSDLEGAIVRFNHGPIPPSGILPYDAIFELNSFLHSMRLSYPSYWSDSWDSIWDI